MKQIFALRHFAGQGAASKRGLVLAVVATTVLVASGEARAVCPAPLAVQVLGSGGPVSDDARASSGYVLWVGGEARLMVDAGGGTFLRFGEAKGRFDSLDAIAITHLHADHVADLVAILKSGFFSDRKRVLAIIGPSGGKAFPAMSEFMRVMFDPKRGAYRYLSGYLDGSGGLAKAGVTDVNVGEKNPSVVLSNDHFKLTATGVKHGPVPALGYLVEAGGRRVAFAGDQNGDNPAFAALIKDADILVMDHAVPETTDPASQKLHARPSEIGALAAKAGVKRLVLSHNMARSLEPLKDNLAIIAKLYSGSTVVAEDLMCLDLAADGNSR